MQMPETLSYILKSTLFDRDPNLEEQDVIDQVLRWVGSDGKRPGLLLTKPSLYFLSKGAGGLNQELLPVGAERQGQSGGLAFEGQRPVIIPNLDYPGVPFEMLPRFVAAQAVELFREHRAGSRLGPDPNMLTPTDMITEVNPSRYEPEEELSVIDAQRRMRASYGMRLLRYMDARLKVPGKKYIHFDLSQGRSELKNEKGSYNSGQSTGIAMEENPETVVQVVFRPRSSGGQKATQGQFRNSVIQLCRQLAEKEDIGSLPMTMGKRMVVHFTKGRVPIGMGEVYQAMGNVGGKMVGGRSSARGTRLDYKDMQYLDCIATKESFVGLREQPFMFAFSLHIQPRPPRSGASTPNEGGHKINTEVASGLAITPLTKQFSHGYDDHPEVVLYRAGDLLQKAVAFYRIAGLMDIPDGSSIEVTNSEDAVRAFTAMRADQPKEGKLGDLTDAVVCHAVSEGRDAIMHYAGGRAVLCLGRTTTLTNLRQTNELELLCSDLGIDELTVECTVPNIELAQMNYGGESEESLDAKTVLWDEMIIRLKRIPGDSWRQWTTLALIADGSIRPERYSMGGIQELYYDEVVQGEAQAVMAYDEDNRRTIVYAPRLIDAVVIAFDTAGKRPQNGEVGNLLVALLDTERVKIGKRRRKTEIYYPLGTISTFSGFTVENRRGMFEHLVEHITHYEGDMAFVDPVRSNLILRIEYDGFANERPQVTYRMKHQRALYEGATYRPQPEGVLGTLPGESSDYNLDRLVGLGGAGLIDIGPSYLMPHGERRMPILRNPRVIHLSSYIRSLSDLLQGDPKMVAAFGKKRGEGKDAVFDTGVPLAQINPPAYEMYPGGIAQMIADQIRMGSLKQKPQGVRLGFHYPSIQPGWKDEYPQLAGRLEQAKERGFAVHFNPPTINFSTELDGEIDDPRNDPLSVKDLLDRSLERRGVGSPLNPYVHMDLYALCKCGKWSYYGPCCAPMQIHNCAECNKKSRIEEVSDWQLRPPLPNPYPRFTAHRQQVPWDFDQDIFDGSTFRTLTGKKFNQTRGMLNANKRYSDLYDQGIAVQAIVGKIDGKWAVQSYRVPKQHKTRRLKREIQLDDAKAPKWYQKKHPASAPYGQKKKPRHDRLDQMLMVDMVAGLGQLLANPLEMAESTIISFSGPSGSGKSTVAAHLEERLPGSEIILSYTTRERRPDEVDGFDKHFVTKESFEEMIEKGLFTTPNGTKLYQQQGNGHYYGRRFDELMSTQFPIVDVSFKGLRQLREAFGEERVFSVFLRNKLTEERRVQIMMQRGEMTEEEARERAMVGTQMLKDFKRYNFDAVVENRFGRLYQTGTIVKKKLFEAMDSKDNPPFKCMQCGHKEFTLDGIRTVGDNITRVFDIQNRRFKVKACAECGFVELYQKKKRSGAGSIAGNLFDLVTNPPGLEFFGDDEDIEHTWENLDDGGGIATYKATGTNTSSEDAREMVYRLWNDDPDWIREIRDLATDNETTYFVQGKRIDDLTYQLIISADHVDDADLLDIVKPAQAEYAGETDLDLAEIRYAFTGESPSYTDDWRKGIPNPPGVPKPIPEFLFHVTARENMESILETGLKPKIGELSRSAFGTKEHYDKKIGSPVVWGATQNKVTIYASMVAPFSLRIDNAVFRIKTEGLDFQYYGNEEYFTRKEVPPSHIKFLYYMDGEHADRTKQNPPGVPKPGKELSMKRKREIRKRWLELVNMTHTELQRFYDSDLGNKRAGLSRDEAKAEGISSGRDSALAIIKMKQTPVKDWHKTRSKDRARGIMLDFWQWAQKQINFNTRHRAMRGAYLDDKGRPKRKLLGLWIWGHDPWRYALKVDPEPMPPCPDKPWVGSREKKAFGVQEVKK